MWFWTEVTLFKSRWVLGINGLRYDSRVGPSPCPSGANKSGNDGEIFAKNCPDCRYIHGGEGWGGGTPGMNNPAVQKAVQGGSGDALIGASVFAPVPSVGKLKAAEKLTEWLVKIRGGKGSTVAIEKFSAYIFKEGATHGKDPIFRGLGYSAEHSSQLAKIFQYQGAKAFANGNYTAGNLIIKNGVNHGRSITININLRGIGASSTKSYNFKSGWVLRNNGSISLSTPFSGFVK